MFLMLLAYADELSMLSKPDLLSPRCQPMLRSHKLTLSMAGPTPLVIDLSFCTFDCSARALHVASTESPSCKYVEGLHKHSHTVDTQTPWHLGILSQRHHLKHDANACSATAQTLHDHEQVGSAPWLHLA
jgi:hypothetical protein